MLALKVKDLATALMGAAFVVFWERLQPGGLAWWILPVEMRLLMHTRLPLLWESNDGPTLGDFPHA